MKVTEIAALSCFFGASICSAFVPLSSSHRIPSRTTSAVEPLNANLLEGWKVDGTLKPLTNFILVKSVEDKSKTDSGILVTSKITKTEGTVISTGPGSYHADSGIQYPMPVAPGNGVIYGEYDGITITMDGIKHTLIRDTDILVKYTGDTDSIETVDPVNDSVLVYVDTDGAAVTSGGLLLGDQIAKSNRPSTGKVVKVGPGRMVANGELMPMTVEVGDMVKFRDMAGNEIKIDGKEYSVVKMGEIMAKF